MSRFDVDTMHELTSRQHHRPMGPAEQLERLRNIALVDRRRLALGARCPKARRLMEDSREVRFERSSCQLPLQTSPLRYPGFLDDPSTNDFFWVEEVDGELQEHGSPEPPKRRTPAPTASACRARGRSRARMTLDHPTYDGALVDVL
ncbi:MAG: hypothetical protein HC923_10455 [Myxococcales bacterium]|nr:hypothetical protein [Myxococcales bacterium]